MIDLYELLEVSPRASEDVIAAAWRRLARTAHPDAGGDAERFVELEAAYATLCDPSKRASYDLERRRVAEEAGRSEAVTTAWSPPVWTAEGEAEPTRSTHWAFALWRGFEEHASALLAFSPRPIGIAVCALGGFALSEGLLQAFQISLPDPASLTRWILVGAVTLLCAAGGWLIGRHRSPIVWRRAVRSTALAFALLCAAGLVELLIGLLPILVVAAVVVLWIRHRHRVRVGAGQ